MSGNAERVGGIRHGWSCGVQIGVLRDLFCQLQLLYSVKGQCEKRSGPEKQSGQRWGRGAVLGNSNQAEEFPLGVGDLEGGVESPARKVWGHQGHLWKCISPGINGKEKPILVLTGKGSLFIGTVSRDNLIKVWRRFRKMNEGW